MVVGIELAAVIGLAFLGAAVLYSSVGHGGASAYLAIMALAGLEPLVMRPTALVLNVVVAGVVVVRFARAGQLPIGTLLPFLAGSVPLAFIGGAIVLPTRAYEVLVGLVLLVAAGRLWQTAARHDDAAVAGAIPRPASVLVGAALGLLAGLTGTGGGIFLTPLLLFLGWAPPRTAAALSAGFILVNSLAGLAGNVAVVGVLPPALAAWVPAVVVGGLIGSELSLRRLSPVALRRALAVVLVVAAVKLLLLG